MQEKKKVNFFIAYYFSYEILNFLPYYNLMFDEHFMWCLCELAEIKLVIFENNNSFSWLYVYIWKQLFIFCMAKNLK